MSPLTPVDSQSSGPPKHGFVADVLSATAETVEIVAAAGLVSLGVAAPTAVAIVLARRSPHQVLRLLGRITDGCVAAGQLVPFVVLAVGLLAVAEAVGMTRPASADSSATPWPAIEWPDGWPVLLVPLVLSGALVGTRTLERHLTGVDPATVEAVQVTGARARHTARVVLAEASPQLVRGLASTLRWLVACSAVVGLVADHGLGGLLGRTLAGPLAGAELATTAAGLIALVVVIHLVGLSVSRWFERAVV